MSQGIGKIQKLSIALLFVVSVGAIVVVAASPSHHAETDRSGVALFSNNHKMKQGTTRATTESIPQNTEGSENWAGYIDTPSSSSTGYTSVTGNWVVPAMSGSQDGAAAQWIGLGGSSNQDLLQIGTTEQVTSGQTQVQVFWEKLPDVAQNVMTVPVGSKIAASIAQGSASTWNLTVNVTTPSGQTETKTIPVTLNRSYAAGIGTSAEWISEDPSDQNNQLYPLADTGTVDFTNATVDGSALTDSTNQVQPIAMVDRAGDILIAPSSVGTDGASFSTTTNLTQSSTTIPGGSGMPTQQFPFGERHHGQHRWGNDGWQSVGNQQGYGYFSFPYDGIQVQIYWQ